MIQKLTLILFSVTILIFTFPFYGPICFFLIVILAIIFIYIVKPKLKNWGIYVRNKSDQLVQICEYCFGGLVDILLTSSEKYFISQYVSKFKNFTTIKYKSDILNLLPSMSLMLIGQISLVILTLYMVLSEKTAQEITSTLALLILLSSRIIPAVNRFSGDITGFIRSFGFISRLLKLRHDLFDMQINKKERKDLKTINDFNTIKLDKIYYSYNKNQNILKNLSFEFKKQYLWNHGSIRIWKNDSH